MLVGLWKSQVICIAIKISLDIGQVTSHHWIAVLVHAINYTAHHSAFIDSASHQVSLWDIFVEPNLYHSLLVDSYVLFLNHKTPHLSGEFSVPSQTLPVEVQVIRIWDVLNICQSYRYFFQEDGVSVAVRAQPTATLIWQIKRSYYAPVILAKIVYVLEPVYFLRATTGHLILFDVLCWMTNVLPSYAAGSEIHHAPVALSECSSTLLLPHTLL